MAPNQKAKRDLQRLKIREDKPVVSVIDKDGPIVDSPVAIDSGERYPEGPSQENLSGTTPSEHKAPCENPHCKQCGRGVGDYPTNVLPNNDNPFSGL